jgi:hypothetical protein
VAGADLWSTKKMGGPLVASVERNNGRKGDSRLAAAWELREKWRKEE